MIDVISYQTMSMDWVLGAINKESGEYENLWFVDKKNKYKCIGCANDLTLRMGQKNFQSFIHKVTCGCEYFKNPSTEQVISDANLFLIKLLKTNQVRLFRKCAICKFAIKIPLELNSGIKLIDMSNNIIHCYDFNDNLISRFYVYVSNPNTNVLANISIISNISNNDNKLYLINVTQLVQRLVKDFGSGQVELTCFTNTVCANFEKYV
jgi:hypothetical protein